MIHRRLVLCLILTLGAFAEEPRVSLHYEKAELGAVLRDLAGLWHKPVLIAPGVEGSFTGNFGGIQVQEAIRQVVRMSPAALDGKLVCGTLVVAPAGFPLTVEEIRVVGNQRTGAETVIRNMRTKVGDTIVPSRLMKDLERLKNIGFFKTVQLALKAGKQPDQVVVELRVVEQASGLATIGLGCMTPWRPNWLPGLRPFGVEVDSASYGYLRDFLKRAQLPPARAVRLEEWLNYFKYRDPIPHGEQRFCVSSEVAACPWNSGHRLLRLTIQAKPRAVAEALPPRNLVFLIQISSLNTSRLRHPLVTAALRNLLNHLNETDRVAVVEDWGTCSIVLKPTLARPKNGIHEALEAVPYRQGDERDSLQLAYELARANFVAGAINRVILVTDGGWGQADEDDLIRRQRELGVPLSILSFGVENLKDTGLERMAKQGGGNIAYIDSLRQARQSLLQEVGETHMPVTHDVTVEVRFDPERVATHRVFGYEDGGVGEARGDLEAGQQVSALYEVETKGAGGELAHVEIGCRESSQPLTLAVPDSRQEFCRASDDLRLAASVVGLGLLLQDSPAAISYEDVERWAESAQGLDGEGRRAEFLLLVGEARKLAGLGNRQER